MRFFKGVWFAMLGRGLLAFLLALFVFSATAFAANSVSLQVFLPKTIFSSNESVEFVGNLFNVSTEGSSSNFTGISGASVVVNVSHSNGSLERQVAFTTDANGSFYSQSAIFPSAQLFNAPADAGSYVFGARYDDGSANHTLSQQITVNSTNSSVDRISLALSKVDFLPSEPFAVTATAFSGTGSGVAGVSSYNVSVILAYSNGTRISSNYCVTGSDGVCSASFSAPSSSGSYRLIANDFLGYSYLRVVPFAVQALVRDDAGVAQKDVFSSGEAGTAELQVSVNGSAASGNYSANLSIALANGTLKSSLQSIYLNSSNSHVASANFSTAGFDDGSYYLDYNVSDGSEIVGGRTWFFVRTGSLSVEKAEVDSGFEQGFSTLPNSSLVFNFLPTYRANGSVILGLAGNFSISLRTPLGYGVHSSNSTVFNSSCRSSGCYQHNFSAPSAAGEYALSVSVGLGASSLSAQAVVTVSPLSVSAFTAESTGAAKGAFSPNEFVFVFFSARNSSSLVNISQAELSSVSFENGSRINYSEGSWDALNASASNYSWAWNSSALSLKLVPPKRGGLYSVTLWLENRTAFATAQFLVRPYDLCVSAKASSSTSSNDYYWQFRKNDVIYLDIAAVQASNPVGTTVNSSFNSSAGGLYGYGSGLACTINSGTQQAVDNATIAISSVVNTIAGVAETLNSSASSCQASTTSGRYLCTLKSNSTWQSGRHVVSLSITGSDNQTSGAGSGYFETREFFIYGYSQNWQNKPNSTINLTVNAYEGGGGWWTSSQGLTGTVSVQKVEFMGSYGSWGAPSAFNYNTSAINSSTLSNGQASVSLNASLAPGGEWSSGSYVVTLKATTSDGRTDYGQAWFDVRKWDAYASPVEYSSSTFNYKYEHGSRDNVSLYVKISNAGDYSYYGGGGQSLGGNVSIRVKKLQQYNTWPPSDLNSSVYFANSISVSTSSPWYSSANSSYLGYVINLTPASRWPSGYYNVLLDINGTETGWGWFNVRAFYAQTSPVTPGGAYAYSYQPSNNVSFNVTSARTSKWNGQYSASELINTTVVSAKLRAWSETTYSYVDFANGSGFNLSSTQVNGTAVINFTRQTSWPSGWYSGELVLENNESERETAYIWFSIIPFNVQLTGPYSISTRSNATVNVSITDPTSSSYSTPLYGNYSIVSVTWSQWSGFGNTLVPLNFTAPAWFNQTANITIQPPSASWNASYYSLTMTVRSNGDNSTRSGWYGFEAKPFTVSISNPRWNYASSENVTVNVTLTDPATSLPAAGNITTVFEYSWPSRTTYNFTVGACDSATATGGCSINASSNVTITAPAGAWQEKYYYLYAEITEPDNNASIVQAYGINFNVIPPVQAYYTPGATTFGTMPGNSSNSTLSAVFSYKWSFNSTENVTMYLYSIRNSSESAANVTVNSVEYAPYDYSCWQESCRNYVQANWSALTFNQDGSASLSSGPAQLNGSGYIHINPPSGGWQQYSNYLRFNVTEATIGNTSIKGTSFYVYG